MASDYVRGDDGGGPVDERLVEELIEARTSLRQARNFKAADNVRDDLLAMGVTLWDRDRVWMVGTNAPKRQQGGDAGGGRDSRRRVGTSGRSPPEDRGRIFVEGLSYETTWQTLKDHFNDAGYPTVYTSISFDRDAGRSKGCGVVEYNLTPSVVTKWSGLEPERGE